MIKTILVPTSGSSTDASVFATAFAIARPTAAHLDFYHLRFSEYEAAVRRPPVQYCRGRALSSALETLREQGELLSLTAGSNFKTFCEENGIAVQTVPGVASDVSASWTEEIDQPDARLMFHARHSDLVVIGRPHNADLMPYNLIESLLMGGGRPLVIAPDIAPSSVTGTIMVGWKEVPAATRALAAAMPLLRCARRVVLVGIAEHDTGIDAGVPESLDRLLHQLAWHGINAEVLVGSCQAGPPAVQLPRMAAELHADLLVVGGFGHRPLREVVFGGVTLALIRHGELPIFMLH